MPIPVVNGEPTSQPSGAPDALVMVAQFVPSVSPTCVQVRAIIALDETPFPGCERYFDAIGPIPVNASNFEVSYQPCAVVLAVSGLVSQLKNANTLFFQMGPPTLPP